MRSIIYLYCTILFFASCDKIITLPIKDNETKLVIEASITDQPGPYFVKLTRSINLNETNNYPVVENGIVIITDNTGIKDTLKYAKEGHLQDEINSGGIWKDL